MIRIEEALKKILPLIKPLPSEETSITNALDRVLAEDVYSDIDLPLLDNSAMDGYALRASDTKGATKTSPVTLDVIEDVRAGYLAKRTVGKNQAIRIMTGAPIPSGADGVVMVEDTSTENRQSVQIFKEAKKGDHIRKKGEDIKNGELAIAARTLLASAHIGMLASLGKSEVKVTRKPKIAILATGDEVIDIDEKLEPGKLRNSNTYTLYSQVIRCGGVPKNLGIAKDKPEELESKITQGLDCDMIITSGGVSVGDYDLVKFILAKMGTDIKFWKVAVKPGKPLAFGVIKGVPVFGLPGNPVSSMVSFETFVRPAMLKMLGRDPGIRKEVDAVLEEDIKKKPGRRHFIRANTRWEDGIYLTRSTGPQGSGILKSMTLANSFIILPEEKELASKGTKVTVRFLD